jgi:hypothetical protein
MLIQFDAIAVQTKLGYVFVVIDREVCSAERTQNLIWTDLRRILDILICSCNVDVTKTVRLKKLETVKTYHEKH